MRRRNFLTALVGGAAVTTLPVQARTEPVFEPPKYRDPGPWGEGSSGPLMHADIDNNFYQIHKRLLALEKRGQ